MTDDPEPPRCANCGRTPYPGENPDDEWRAESDGVGELHVFCLECWRQEFEGGNEDGPPGWRAFLRVLMETPA